MNETEEIKFIEKLDDAFGWDDPYQPLLAKDDLKTETSLSVRLNNFFKFGLILLIIVSLTTIAYFMSKSILETLETIVVGLAVCCCFIILFADVLTADDSIPNTSNAMNMSQRATRKFLNSLHLYIDDDSRSDMAIYFDRSENDWKTDYYPYRFFTLIQYGYAIGLFNEAKEIVTSNTRLLSLAHALNKIDSYNYIPDDLKKCEKLKGDYRHECRQTAHALAKLVKPTAMREIDRIMKKNNPKEVKLLPDRYQKQAVNNFVKNL